MVLFSIFDLAKVLQKRQNRKYLNKNLKCPHYIFHFLIIGTRLPHKENNTCRAVSPHMLLPSPTLPFEPINPLVRFSISCPPNAKHGIIAKFSRKFIRKPILYFRKALLWNRKVILWNSKALHGVCGSATCRNGVFSCHPSVF